MDESEGKKNASMLHGWHYSKIHIIHLLGNFPSSHLYVCLVYVAFLEKVLKPQRSWGSLVTILHSISSFASECKTVCVIQQQATPELCWKRFLHVAAEINAFGIFPWSPKTRPAYKYEPQEFLLWLLSQRCMEHQAIMSPCKQQVCGTKVSPRGTFPWLLLCKVLRVENIPTGKWWAFIMLYELQPASQYIKGYLIFPEFSC